jgi:hypothetical protein
LRAALAAPANLSLSAVPAAKIAGASQRPFPAKALHAEIPAAALPPGRAHLVRCALDGHFSSICQTIRTAATTLAENPDGRRRRCTRTARLLRPGLFVTK